MSEPTDHKDKNEYTGASFELTHPAPPPKSKSRRDKEVGTFSGASFENARPFPETEESVNKKSPRTRPLPRPRSAPAAEPHPAEKFFAARPQSEK